VTSARKLDKRLKHECLDCTEQALPDSDRCGPHEEKELRRVREAQKKRRKNLRRSGKCIDCKRRSKKWRCARCYNKTKAKSVTDTVGVVTKPEIWRVDPGTNWQRYRGTGRRGRRTRQEQAEEDKRDLRWAIAKLQAFEPEIDRLITPTVLEMPRIQREAERRKSTSCLDEALRFIEGLQAKYE
jgi:hypothetical protein